MHIGTEGGKKEKEKKIHSFVLVTGKLKHHMSSVSVITPG